MKRLLLAGLAGLLGMTLFVSAQEVQEVRDAMQGNEAATASDVANVRSTGASPKPTVHDIPVAQTAAPASESLEVAAMPAGDVERGRLVFGACRTCHYAQAAMGHNNGPNLHRIFGRVAGKQEGFDYYSEVFRAAEFVWTPQLMYSWLEDPMAMFPESTMMSLGVPDSRDRADLIAYLEQASVRDP